MQPDRDTLTALLTRMLLIRRMEERLGEVVQSGELPGPVHLYIGQEAVAAGVCSHLDDRDWIASTHRGHGHFLAKGDDPRAMVAEIFGRDAGICHGKSGSMHVADFGRGILGANGSVVASGSPWARRSPRSWTVSSASRSRFSATAVRIRA